MQGILKDHFPSLDRLECEDMGRKKLNNHQNTVFSLIIILGGLENVLSQKDRYGKI